MHKWTIAVLAIVGVGVIAALGLGWYALNRPVDLNSPMGRAYAENFLKQFNESCLTEAEKVAGAAAGKAMKEKFVVACACAADAIFEEYKDDPPVKMFTATSDEGEQETIGRIMRTCTQQAGMQ